MGAPGVEPLAVDEGVRALDPQDLHPLEPAPPQELRHRLGAARHLERREPREGDAGNAHQATQLVQVDDLVPLVVGERQIDVGLAHGSLGQAEDGL